MPVASWIRSLLGISTYTSPPPSAAMELDSPQVERTRTVMGGQLAATPVTQVRWILKDLELASYGADAGDLSLAARLWNASKRDGVFSGVLSTRTGGLVRLPKKFRGDAEIIEELEVGHDSVRSVFDEMCPPAELALLAEDGIGPGVGVAELIPVEGRDYPVLCRLPPENLSYRWVENRWYYKSVAGLLPITPGDGRWVLHIPGGRIAPWQSGMWRAVGRAFINKEHALLMDANWQAKLANPARVAVSPQGATDEQMQGWFRKVMAWGVNTVFGLKPGWDVKLLESNGVGSQAFDRTVKRSEREMIVAIAGQEVTTDGGAGFQNSDIHKSIRADLIKATADGLAYTVNTQVIPTWVLARWGEERLANSPCLEWDVTPPRDRTAEANAYVSVGNAIKGLLEALQNEPIELDTQEFCDRFNVPVRERAASDTTTMPEQTPGVVSTATTANREAA